MHDTSGADGNPGEDGNPGVQGTGVRGMGAAAGTNGQHGTPGSPNMISLMSVPNQKIFIVSPKDSDKDAVILPLYDGKVSITLKAMGGSGGNGGHGGKGMYCCVLVL